MRIHGGVVDRLHRTYNKPSCDEVAAIFVEGAEVADSQQHFLAMNTKGGQCIIHFSRFKER